MRGGPRPARGSAAPGPGAVRLGGRARFRAVGGLWLGCPRRAKGRRSRGAPGRGSGRAGPRVPRAAAAPPPPRAPTTCQTPAASSHPSGRPSARGDGWPSSPGRSEKRNRCSTAKRRWYQRHTWRRSGRGGRAPPDQPQRLGRAGAARQAGRADADDAQLDVGRGLGVQAVPHVQAHHPVVGIDDELGAVAPAVGARLGQAEDGAVLAPRAAALVRPRPAVEAAVGRQPGQDVDRKIGRDELDHVVAAVQQQQRPRRIAARTRRAARSWAMANVVAVPAARSRRPTSNGRPQLPASRAAPPATGTPSPR